MDSKLLKGLHSLFENEQALRKLKDFAVSYQEYEFAADLRAIEREKYPKNEKDTKKIDEAIMFKKALSLAEIKMSDEVAFVMLSVAKKLVELGSEIDLKTIAGITVEADHLFGK